MWCCKDQTSYVLRMSFNLHLTSTSIIKHTQDSYRWRCHLVFSLWVLRFSRAKLLLLRHPYLSRGPSVFLLKKTCWFLSEHPFQVGIINSGCLCFFKVVHAYVLLLLFFIKFYFVCQMHFTCFLLFFSLIYSCGKSQWQTKTFVLGLSLLSLAFFN